MSMFNMKNKDKQHSKGGRSASKNNNILKTSSGAKKLNTCVKQGVARVNAWNNLQYFSFFSFVMKLL